MNKFLSILITAVFAVSSAGAFAAAHMKAADDKKMDKAAARMAATKELKNDDKVRVLDVTFKPGDEAPSVARPARVIIYVKGGTLQRTYPDGKKESTTYKDGEVQYFGATPPYAVKNVGKTTVHLYSVAVK